MFALYPKSYVYLVADFSCSDPFIKMMEANKTYGFTIAVKELRETVPNIFRYAAAYKRKNNLKSKGLWEMFLERPAEEDAPPEDEKKQEKLPEEILRSEPGDNTFDDVDPEAMEGESYNMCHFWSNFEIARLDWFRSKEYEDFFQMMDRSGGFWMERVSGLRPELFSWLNTDVCAVGRCSYPFPRSRRSSWSRRHPLFPRFRLPAHYDPALPGQCARPSTTP